MTQRIITAVIFVPAVLLIVWLNPLLTRFGLAAVALISLFELRNAFRELGLQIELPSVIVFLIVNFCWPNWRAEVFFFSLLLFVGWTLSRACLYFPKVSVQSVLAQLFAALYPSLSLLCAADLRLRAYGAEALTLAFLLTWSYDTFAYFGGIFRGRHHPFPELSPKKSVEGIVSGTLGTVAVALLCWRFIPAVQLWQMLLVALGAAFLAQLGDLTESMIKRFCGIKDSGRLLPGHGGFLDRFDAFFFVVAWIYGIYLFLGV